MANQCLYEPIYGDYPKDCNGACKYGYNNYCPYYFVDPITKIINDWRKEAHVKEPVIIKKDYKKKKFYIYTNRPGWLIGRAGCLVNKYGSLLNKELIISFTDENGVPEKQDFIEFVDCDEVVGWDDE